MKVPLSPRLQACCCFVAPGDRVADIGTDHGYLGIWLLQQKIASSVIAADIVPGPLSSARYHAEKFGCAEQMVFCLSDGLASVPRDFNTMVCAGMGADTMISIISAAPWLKSKSYRLVLQCQSKTPALRRFLNEEGYQIENEVVVRDGRFLYTVMEVKYTPGHRLTPAEQYFSPALLRKPNSYTGPYYRDVVRRLERALTGQGAKTDPHKKEALQQLQELANDPAFAFLREETL